MATAQSTLLSSLAQSASAGLAGGASLNRSVVDGAHRQVKIGTFTIPASGAGSADGDVIQICGLNVFARIISVQVLHQAMGAGVTLDIGKTDPNNSANNDATHYANGVDVANIGNFFANANLGEQVGTDPTGAVTDTGNAIPKFGSDEIMLTATIHTAPTAAKVLTFIVDYSARP